jgi:hypothetical protein
MWTQESTMIQVLVHHQVTDYKSWRSVFDAALDFRHDGGECSCRIFRKAGNPNDLTLLFDFEDMDRARLYMTSDNLREKMRQAGVVGVPEVQYLAEMYTVRRSAAD